MENPGLIARRLLDRGVSARDVGRFLSIDPELVGFLAHRASREAGHLPYIDPREIDDIEEAIARVCPDWNSKAAMEALERGSCISDVARHYGVSRDFVSDEIKRHKRITGQSVVPVRKVNRNPKYDMSLVLDLLRQGYTPTEIANQVGCSRTLVRQYGLSHAAETGEWLVPEPGQPYTTKRHTHEGAIRTVVNRSLSYDMHV